MKEQDEAIKGEISAENGGVESQAVQMQEPTATPAKKEKKAKEKKHKKQKKYDICFGANKKGRHINVLFNVLRVLVVPFIWLMFPFRYYGTRKVKDGAAVYVGNHFRATDPVYPACTTWEGVHYLAKKSILSHPIYGLFCKQLRVIGVNRDGTDVRAIMDALKCLKNGEKIAIFPEGTRNTVSEEEMLEFKGGAAMMAIKGKAPVIPFALYKKPRPFRMNHIIMGEPFELSEYYNVKLTEEVLNEADEKLRQKIVELRQNHAEFLASKKRKKKKKQ